MDTILFIIFLIVLTVELTVIAAKAAWSITKILCAILLCPIFLLALIVVGLLYVAIPVFAIIGLVTLLG